MGDLDYPGRQLQPMIGDGVLPRWIQATYGKDVGSQTCGTGNEAVHGGEVPAVGLVRALAKVLNWLDFFVLAARSGVPVNLIVAEAMTRAGTSYYVDLAMLAGNTRSRTATNFATSTPLPVTLHLGLLGGCNPQDCDQ